MGASLGRYYRRYTKAGIKAASITSLYALAVQDAALAGITLRAYTFDESSGNLLEKVTPGGSFDFSVGAQTTRGVVSPVPDALKAYGFSSANPGGGAPFGHAEGTRPTLNGALTWCVEAVVRFGNAPASGTKYGVDAEGAGASKFTLNRGSGGTVQVAVNPNGNNQGTLTGSPGTGWHHVVWGVQDGAPSLHVAYLDAVQAFSTSLGANHVACVDSTPTWALGGVYGFSTLNLDIDMAFFALYNGLYLSPTQITAHKAKAGL
jgi:hypothetical protein